MDTVTISTGVMVLLVGMALVFDFMNGFHDAANAIATGRIDACDEAAYGRGDGGHLQRRRYLRV